MRPATVHLATLTKIATTLVEDVIRPQGLGLAFLADVGSAHTRKPWRHQKEPKFGEVWWRGSELN